MPRPRLFLLLIPAFLLCYMEWGGGQSGFVWDVFIKVLTEKEKLRDNLMHPVILSGLLGMLAMLYCGIAAHPPRKVQLITLLLPGIVVLLILLSGLLSQNVKMVLSAFPYITISLLIIRSGKKTS